MRKATSSRVLLDYQHAAWGWESRGRGLPRHRTKAVRYRHLVSLANVIETAALHETVFLTNMDTGDQEVNKIHEDVVIPSGFCHLLSDFGFDHPRLSACFKSTTVPWIQEKYLRIIPPLQDNFDNIYEHSLLNLVAQAWAASDFASAQEMVFVPRPDVDPRRFLATQRRLNCQLNAPLFKAYGHLRDAISQDLMVLLREGRSFTLPLPPIASLVFQRASSPKAIGPELFAIREELHSVTRALSEYQRAILDPGIPLADALESREILHSVYHDLRLPYLEDRGSIQSWSDVLSLPKDLLDGVNADDFESGSVTKAFLGKPLQALLKYIRRRKAAILFTAKKNYYSQDLQADVLRLFGDTALT